MSQKNKHLTFEGKVGHYLNTCREKYRRLKLIDFEEVQYADIQATACNELFYKIGNDCTRKTVIDRLERIY